MAKRVFWGVWDKYGDYLDIYESESSAIDAHERRASGLGVSPRYLVSLCGPGARRALGICRPKHGDLFRLTVEVDEMEVVDG